MNVIDPDCAPLIKSYDPLLATMKIVMIAQGDLVYSVKWYKGGLEIFRYLPSFKDQPITTFPRSGVIIDEVSLIVH